MSPHLPERASLEYLKKLARERLRALRRTDPRTQLANALLDVAREHGFSSWRALKAEVERRHDEQLRRLFAAIAAADADTVRALIATDDALARAVGPDTPHGGWTALHAAAQRGHLAITRTLLERGADLHAREEGDNTTPLHWAAAHGHPDVVRALLDAGADVHGVGDVHRLDVIGWAAFFREPTDEGAALDPARREVVALLLERGARHHIFSAMSVGDVALVEEVVEQDPDALDRRMSRFEQGQTPLHFAINRHRHDMLERLVELGADLEAEDGRGQTALALAMLKGDSDAMRLLHAAGARPPAMPTAADFQSGMRELARTVTKGVPMMKVADVRRTLEWYVSVGFTEVARFEDNGLVNFGMVSFGRAEVMLTPHGTSGEHEASLWFYTDRVDALYQRLKARQLSATHAALAGGTAGHDGIEFEQDIEDMFYGARQFCIRDVNGCRLYFIQSRERRADS